MSGTTIAPVLGDWIISPGGKKWRVMYVLKLDHETVYEIQRANSDKHPIRRSMYLRELARWKKAEA